MSSKLVPFYEAQLTPDGHQALLALAAANGVPPSALLDIMLASYEPHLFDALAMKADLAKIRTEFDAIVAREFQYFDTFGTLADVDAVIEAVAVAVVKTEMLRRRPRSTRLVDVAPSPPVG